MSKFLDISGLEYLWNKIQQTTTKLDENKVATTVVSELPTNEDEIIPNTIYLIAVNEDGDNSDSV